MTQLLVGTKKGRCGVRGRGGSPFQATSRAFAGEPVEFATRDARTGRHFACVTSAFYGPKVFYADDLTAEWEQAAGVELPEGAEQPLERLWTVVPAEDDGHMYAGGAPGVLFESRDEGKTWELNKAFWEQPTRPDWSPGAVAGCAWGPDTGSTAKTSGTPLRWQRERTVTGLPTIGATPSASIAQHAYRASPPGSDTSKSFVQV